MVESAKRPGREPKFTFLGKVYFFCKYLGIFLFIVSLAGLFFGTGEYALLLFCGCLASFAVCSFIGFEENMRKSSFLGKPVEKSIIVEEQDDDADRTISIDVTINTSGEKAEERHRP